MKLKLRVNKHRSREVRESFVEKGEFKSGDYLKSYILSKREYTGSLNIYRKSAYEVTGPKLTDSATALPTKLSRRASSRHSTSVGQWGSGANGLTWKEGYALKSNGR